MQLMALQEMRERDRKTALDECERDLHALDTELRMLFRVGVAASVTWHFFQWWQWDTVGMSVSSWLWGYCAGTLSYVLTVVACFLARRAYHSFAFDQIKTKRVMRLTAVERAHADTKKKRGKNIPHAAPNRNHPRGTKRLTGQHITISLVSYMKYLFLGLTTY